MGGFRYEQLNTNADVSDFNYLDKQNYIVKGKSVRPIFKTLGLISVYFTLSIGLTFYQRWLVKSLNFHLSIVVFHLAFKFALAAGLRLLITKHRANISFGIALRSVAPTGLASGIDVGLSNWGLGLVTMSLYTMTKSTTIVFILGFAIILGLEKKSWSLMAIVITISSGLALFTYKATQFDGLGFTLLLLASLCAGMRWTFAQLVMQRYKLGLNNPLEMLYHMQPWMLVSIMPVAFIFEGFHLWSLFASISSTSYSIIGYILILLCVGAALAFIMEIFEYLVVHNTSSLTLSITGIFKEIVQLIFAVEVNGDQLSLINSFGLLLCLLGIVGHIWHKSIKNKNSESTNHGLINKSDRSNALENSDSKSTEEEIERILQIDKINGKRFLLEDDGTSRKGLLSKRLDSDDDEQSDPKIDQVIDESDQLIFDILKRQDYVSKE